MKLSVIMATYNGSETIHLAIKSILNQSFSDFEFIICDDCSTDTTYEILSEFQQLDPRIKLLQNTSNLRVAASRNRCIEESQGEFIAIIDDDDIALPQRFEKQIDFLEKHHDFAFVGSNAYYFETNEILIWGKTHFAEEQSTSSVFKGFGFVTPSTMYRFKSLQMVEGFTVSKLTRRTEDYDLYCKLYSFGFKGYNLDEILLLYREDLNTIKRRKFQHRIDSIRLRLRWRKRLNLGVEYLPTVFAPILSGLIPQRVLFYRRKRRNKKFLKEYSDTVRNLLPENFWK